MAIARTAAQLSARAAGGAAALCAGRLTHLSVAFSSGDSGGLRLLRTVATPFVITHPQLPPVQRLGIFPVSCMQPSSRLYGNFSLSCADTPQSSSAEPAPPGTARC